MRRVGGFDGGVAWSRLGSSDLESLTSDGNGEADLRWRDDGEALTMMLLQSCNTAETLHAKSSECPESSTPAEAYSLQL